MVRVSRGVTPILTFPRRGGRDKSDWIPAFAGMTVVEVGMAGGVGGNEGRRSTLRQAQGERVVGGLVACGGDGC